MWNASGFDEPNDLLNIENVHTELLFVDDEAYELEYGLGIFVLLFHGMVDVMLEAGKPHSSYRPGNTLLKWGEAHPKG